MANNFLPGSFTKEFGWETKDLQKLHAAIKDGFAGSKTPTIRSHWRTNSGLADPNRELIPLIFFLFSEMRHDDDYVVVDELVNYAVSQPYNRDFDQLALFALHLGINGNWRHKDSGKVDWPNFFIRNYAWQNGAWARGAFDDHVMMDFVNNNVDATETTRRKIKNNYRYILEISGALDGILSQPIDLRPERWGEKACMLFWDRLTYQGSLDKAATAADLKNSFSHYEIHKLLGCPIIKADQIANVAAANYITAKGVDRF